MVNKIKIPKNIFLIGFMGAGKTRVGRIISINLNLSFYDLDNTIESNSGMTISEIFNRFGEEYFRDLETKTLKVVAQKKDQVIATSGGIVLREENWNLMNEGGITIYLRAQVEILWNRVKDNSSRPLLQVNDPLKKMKELLSIRIPLYEKADIIVDTDNLSPESVAEEVIEKLRFLN